MPNHRYNATSWMNLTKGEHYYIRGTHREGTGGDHYTLAVEMKKVSNPPYNASETHHHDSPEMQYLSIEVNNKTMETIEIEIDVFEGVTLTDTDVFTSVFSYQKNSSFTDTVRVLDIKASSTPSEMQTRMNEYFKTHRSLDVYVNKTTYPTCHERA